MLALIVFALFVAVNDAIEQTETPTSVIAFEATFADTNSFDFLTQYLFNFFNLTEHYFQSTAGANTVEIELQFITEYNHNHYIDIGFNVNNIASHAGDGDSQQQQLQSNEYRTYILSAPALLPTMVGLDLQPSTSDCEDEDEATRHQKRASFYKWSVECQYVCSNASSFNYYDWANDEQCHRVSESAARTADDDAFSQTNWILLTFAVSGAFTVLCKLCGWCIAHRQRRSKTKEYECDTIQSHSNFTFTATHTHTNNHKNNHLRSDLYAYGGGDSANKNTGAVMVGAITPPNDDKHKNNSSAAKLEVGANNVQIGMIDGDGEGDGDGASELRNSAPNADDSNENQNETESEAEAEAVIEKEINMDEVIIDSQNFIDLYILQHINNNNNESSDPVSPPPMMMMSEDLQLKARILISQSISEQNMLLFNIDTFKLKLDKKYKKAYEQEMISFKNNNKNNDNKKEIDKCKKKLYAEKKKKLNEFSADIYLKLSNIKQKTIQELQSLTSITTQ